MKRGFQNGFDCFACNTGGAVDCFVRLILSVALLFVAGSANAFGEISSQTSETWACSNGKGGEVISTSPASACASFFAQSSTTSCGDDCRNTTTYAFTGCDPRDGQYAYCRGTTRSVFRRLNGEVINESSGPTGTSAVYRGVSDYCGANSFPSNTGGAKTCACAYGYAPAKDKKSCEQYTCPPSGSYSAVTQPDQKVANAGDSQCSGGCSYTPSSWKVGQDGQIWAVWPFKSTGKFCKGTPSATNPDVDTGEANTKNPAPVPCGLNQCPGSVNGATVCLPCSKQEEKGPSESASAPAGASSGAETGSKESSTSCNGINCTTTTVSKDANGQVTGTAEKTEKQESFCRQNPESSLCKRSSFGGSCGAVTCEGDAIQCAIAADQHRRNCQWFDDPSAAQLADVGNAAITGQSRPDGHPGNSPDSQSVSFQSVIDQTDRLGGGCPVDVTVNVAGKSVAIPFSSMCGNLQLVGNLMVGFCMFAAALIVFRG